MSYHYLTDHRLRTRERDFLNGLGVSFPDIHSCIEHVYAVRRSDERMQTVQRLKQSRSRMIWQMAGIEGVSQSLADHASVMDMLNNLWIPGHYEDVRHTIHAHNLATAVCGEWTGQISDKDRYQLEDIVMRLLFSSHHSQIYDYWLDYQELRMSGSDSETLLEEGQPYAVTARDLSFLATVVKSFELELQKPARGAALSSLRRSQREKIIRPEFEQLFDEMEQSWAAGKILPFSLPNLPGPQTARLGAVKTNFLGASIQKD